MSSVFSEAESSADQSQQPEQKPQADNLLRIAVDEEIKAMSNAEVYDELRENIEVFKDPDLRPVPQIELEDLVTLSPAMQRYFLAIIKLREYDTS